MHMNDITEERRFAIARTVHAAMRSWANIHSPDKPIPEWDQAPGWMHASTFESIDFVLANPQADDGHQHDQWMDQKRRDGWVYGPVKDEARKTHPMMVPFEALPDAEKRKDALLKAIVLALA